MHWKKKENCLRHKMTDEVNKSVWSIERKIRLRNPETVRQRLLFAPEKRAKIGKKSFGVQSNVKNGLRKGIQNKTLTSEIEVSTGHKQNYDDHYHQ